MGRERVTLRASAAATGSGTGPVFNALTDIVGGTLTIEDFHSALFLLDVTAVSGAAPTLNVFIQMEMPDGGWDDVVAFAQILAAGRRIAVIIPNASSFTEGISLDGGLSVSSVRGLPLRSSYRVKWTIGGVGPSFTFSVTADFFASRRI